MSQLHYPTVLFDWGDTVMKDDPASSVPMVEWETVHAIEGINAVLEYLHSSGRRVFLATSASISDESQIRAALVRVNLASYFSYIFCFKNTGIQKGEAFYQHILEKLGIMASKTLMVGDSFEKDVLDPNKVGIYAIWFNPRSDEDRISGMYVTVHSLEDLLSFFISLDH